MRREQRRRVALVCALVTLAWLAGGTLWFAHWQASEGVAVSAALWWNAIEAALLVALVFWVLAGIAYGVIVWIVTGRGPQA
jgi:hypothetical protein